MVTKSNGTEHCVSNIIKHCNGLIRCRRSDKETKQTYSCTPELLRCPRACQCSSPPAHPLSLKNSSTQQQVTFPLSLANPSMVVDGRSSRSSDGAHDHPPGSRSTITKVTFRIKPSRSSQRLQQKTRQATTSVTFSSSTL